MNNKTIITICVAMSWINLVLAAILLIKGAPILASVQLFWALFTYATSELYQYLIRVADEKVEIKPQSVIPVNNSQISKQ